MKTSESWSG